MRTLNKQTKAFTMIELVFVIVVLGILAALAMPRLDRDLRQEAADNILSAIRYTQHLALNDDKTDPFDTNWQKELWQIRFTVSADNKATFYTISSDQDQDGFVDKSETAIDPINGHYMYNASGATVDMDSDESPNIFIGKKYGINSLTLNGGCTVQHLAFDHLGRVHTGIGSATNTYDKYMSSDCTMTFGFADGSDNLDIIIAKETGYAYIVGQEDS